MGSEFKDLADALKGVYSRSIIEKIVEVEAPFRKAIGNVPPAEGPCPHCEGYFDMHWHVEWSRKGGDGWASPSECNKFLVEVKPEERWAAAMDFIQNFGVEGAIYRVVYVGEVVLEHLVEGRGAGQQGSLWTSVWKKKWGFRDEV